MNPNRRESKSETVRNKIESGSEKVIYVFYFMFLFYFFYFMSERECTILASGGILMLNSEKVSKERE